VAIEMSNAILILCMSTTDCTFGWQEMSTVRMSDNFVHQDSLHTGYDHIVLAVAAVRPVTYCTCYRWV